MDKNNNQTYIHKGSLGIQTGCLGGHSQGTEPKQLSIVEIYWNSIRVNIATQPTGYSGVTWFVHYPEGLGVVHVHQLGTETDILQRCGQEG